MKKAVGWQIKVLSKRKSCLDVVCVNCERCRHGLGV